jgi:hypothetical protein
LVVLAVVAYINWNKPGYRRGFGDTILVYKNRSYEGAVWKEVEVSKLADMRPQLNFVIGWEDDDYWVGTKGGIFRYKNGTWTNPSQNGSTGGHPRLLDRNSLLFGSYDAHLIREDGVQKLDGEAGGAFYADHGLLYLINNRGHAREHHRVAFTNLKSLGNKSTKYQTITHGDKEFYIHKDNNTVSGGAYDILGQSIKYEYTIGALNNVVQIAPEKCIGTTNGNGYGDKFLAEFRNGIWYEVTKLPWLSRAMWIDCSGTAPKNAVMVGNRGRVIIYQFDGGKREMEVPTPQGGTTSMELICVWGNSIDKLWTMDSNGTVWEKSGNDWRVVVRGLRSEDIEFKDVWVSPTGTIYAVTDYVKGASNNYRLYQLK